MLRPVIGIVSPVAPGTNNGNGRTTDRWARLLAARFDVRVLPSWNGEPLALLIALHARRSADAIAAWSRVRDAAAPGAWLPLTVVLTGTDLYEDIATDLAARTSLRLADALVVLQDQGLAALPPSLRAKARVIYQSGTTRRTLTKTSRRLRALTVGHLRDEKLPQTLFDAARLLKNRSDIQIHHIGAGLDGRLAAAARRTAQGSAAYEWLGAMPHARTLRWIQRAHVLVHPSRVEGGAHAVLEAVCSGTPVIASDIPGNRGMLGADYDGCFPVGDSAALARMLLRCREDPRWLDHLRKQCLRRARLFEPRREQRALHELVQQLLAAGPRRRQPRKEPGI